MSDRAIEFLERWEADHVVAVPYEQKQDEAGRLAARCLEDALREDISEQDLEAAAEGDLTSYMLAALEAAADDEIGRAMKGDDEAAN